jgi:hypothetical protein
MGSADPLKCQICKQITDDCLQGEAKDPCIATSGKYGDSSFVFTQDRLRLSQNDVKDSA